MNKQDSRNWLSPSGISGRDYEAHFERLEAAGHYIHGEADFVQKFRARSVLDAGCGTGRIARELARRGIDVVGVDIDPSMLATARVKSPHLDWRQGDLSTIDLGKHFDLILLAGNVMLFLQPGFEPRVLKNLTRHLKPGGLLVAGFQILPRRLALQEYDAYAESAGLTLDARWATWEHEPWTPTASYAVSVHRLPER